MKPENRWGIANPTGWYEWEENRLARSVAPSVNASDNGATSEVLLVDQLGRPLVKREPRRVGFRKPDHV